MEHRPLILLNGVTQQLPVGDTIAGSSTGEEEMTYAERTDFASDTLIYKGFATAGTGNAAATWRIQRLSIAGDGDVTVEWADGNASFDNVWNDRASLSYS